MPSGRAALCGCPLRAWFLCCLAWLFANACWASVPSPPAEPQEVQRIEKAWFWLQNAQPAEVQLPDTWGQRGVSPRALGHYRLDVMLSSAQRAEPLGLRFSRLSTQHRVYLNGALVSDQPAGARMTNPGLARPALLSLPPALLRDGLNTITLEVQHMNRPGLSDAELGPLPELQFRHQRMLLRQVALPQALNMACGGVALLMILIWWRRRSELALGSFGLLALMGSVRNYSYFVPTATGSAQELDWFFYAAQVWTVVLLGVFAQAFARVSWLLYQRALLWTASALSLAALAAVKLDWMLELRSATYPVLLLACLPALSLCVRRAQRQPAWSVVLRAAGVAAMFAAAIHDYLFQTAAVLPVTETFWMPYVMPLALGAMALALMQRLVGALTEVEQLNAELEHRVAERTSELERANAAKTRFIAAASHDLRQPLVTIGLLVGVARDSIQLPKARQLMDRVDEAVSSMESLLTGLLDLSRLEAGAVRPRPGPVRLADLFASIRAHEQAAALHKRLRLRFRPTEVVVHSDALILERMLRNLVSNAIRYTQRGSVLVALRRRGERWRLEVRDSGPGIAAEDQALIFQEFVQLGNPVAEAQRGLGLGLTIVQRSAQMLGHPIGVASCPGRGSCFWIELTSVAAPEIPVGPAEPSEALPSLQGWHVLLVEDDAAVRHAMLERLVAWGAEVNACADRSAAMAWIAQAGQAPDAVVSDYRLPDGDGLEVIAEVEQRFGRIAAVLVTGDTAPQELARFDASHVQVLHKPFRPDQLLQRLVQANARRTADIETPS